MDFEVEGLQRTIRKLQQFGVDGDNKIKQVTGVAAQEIATDAAQNLAAYPDADPTGTIAQSINAYPVNQGFTYSISVNQVPMGAYIEFGTGRFVEVAPEWTSLAWQFYVNGKGFMYPRPYLYPAYVQGIRQYQIDLNQALEVLTARFNRS